MKTSCLMLIFFVLLKTDICFTWSEHVTKLPQEKRNQVLKADTYWVHTLDAKQLKIFAIVYTLSILWLLLDRDSNTKCVWCILSLPVSSYSGTHPGTQTMNFSEPSGKQGNRSEPSGKRPRRSSPRNRKQSFYIFLMKKNNCVQKMQTLPWSSCSRVNKFECSG